MSKVIVKWKNMSIYVSSGTRGSSPSTLLEEMHSFPARLLSGDARAPVFMGAGPVYYTSGPCRTRVEQARLPPPETAGPGTGLTRPCPSRGHDQTPWALQAVPPLPCLRCISPTTSKNQETIAADAGRDLAQWVWRAACGPWPGGEADT